MVCIQWAITSERNHGSDGQIQQKDLLGVGKGSTWDMKSGHDVYD